MSASFKRITYTINSTEYNLGYYEYITFNYEGNVQTRIIPRALGVKIWNTSELGGGQLNITVNVFTVASTRMTFEDGIYDLISSLKGSTGTLSIENDTIELTSCYLKDISMENKEGRTGMVTLNFVKSA